MRLAVIPARGGSKRIPRKNIKPFAGKPMIAWSIEAAKASHNAGMSVLMGAPNIVRGKSHSGNIAARDLAELGVLDVLSSDYVPFSLLHAPFILADTIETLDLPQAIAMVTATPARTVNLDDRGRIAPGLRGDLVRVHRRDEAAHARLAELRQRLAGRYSDHYLLIRSVDDWSCPALTAALRADGWMLLPSRQIWVTDDLQRDWAGRKSVKNDGRKLAQSGLVVEDIARLGDADAARILNVGTGDAISWIGR